MQDAKHSMSRVLGLVHQKLKHYGLVAQVMLFLVPIMVRGHAVRQRPARSGKCIALPGAACACAIGLPLPALAPRSCARTTWRARRRW